MQSSSRPLTLQRPSVSSPSATAIPGRQSHARNNSHSLLSTSLNANHRVTRRKSVTNPGPNVAALTAAVANGEQMAAIPIANGGRRNTVSKAALAKTALVGSLPSPPASLPANKTIPEIKHEIHDSAIDDGNDVSADEANKSQNARIRRASDGSPLVKESKKSNRVEVRCDKCGKSYKHSSCLTKHLWEHTPEWSFTSKLLISKHQQVQLLEAASVLVAMNDKESTATPPDSTKDSGSEPDSSSPAASGYSEQIERQSSADTTPPPMLEESGLSGLSYRDSNGAGFARSYQSAVSGSIPNGSMFGHFRQPSHERRPPSSGANRTGEDDRDLAAAVELLSCSFNSNNGSHGTITVPSDAPPVPPVPAQYLDQAPSFSSAGFINSFPSRQPESFTRGEIRRGSQDVKMEDSDDDFDMQSRARSDEDDDGVFGRMEE
ncbi:C2H2 finger domain-containing protein [Pochonia chlamydosporia 170]|uniref:C2H2 finger domain-containing protein n=1 Tax=Pochonia chlamydosporia 170 TaxID=1380566 RepID=A0A179FX15_METCM|nr:C2H2 finger domain-containing protein [Pochonia chlamydosporia 170]OAQ70162.1 C2H2 finger domain-containing protein [Pochonia chlamydosporia 170]